MMCPECGRTWAINSAGVVLLISSLLGLISLYFDFGLLLPALLTFVYSIFAYFWQAEQVVKNELLKSLEK